MVLLRCDGCGGFDFKEVNGLRKCAYCGLEYDPNIIQEQVTKFANTYNINYNIQNLNAQNVYLSGNPDFEIAGGTLIKYHGQSQDVVVPENVSCLGEGAFANLVLRSVKLPAGLRIVKGSPFGGGEISELYVNSIPNDEDILKILTGAKINNMFVPSFKRTYNRPGCIFSSYEVFVNNLYISCQDIREVLEFYGFTSCGYYGDYYEDIYNGYGSVINNIYINNRKLEEKICVEVKYKKRPNYAPESYTMKWGDYVDFSVDVYIEKSLYKTINFEDIYIRGNGIVGRETLQKELMNANNSNYKIPYAWIKKFDILSKV